MCVTQRTYSQIGNQTFGKGRIGHQADKIIHQGERKGKKLGLDKDESCGAPSSSKKYSNTIPIIALELDNQMGTLYQQHPMAIRAKYILNMGQSSILASFRMLWAHVA